MFTINKKKFGAFVASLRKEKGITQKELSEQLCISDKAISKWETGVSLPDTVLLIPLANLLDVSVTELLICGISTFLNYTMEKPCMDSLITFVLMCAVCGAYFCCLVRTKLSRLYDENSVNVFYDGPIRMHVPGITFNNHNWPHIVQVLRLSFCLNMILIPLLNLMASSIAVVAWKNIGKYVFLVIILCSTLLPIYVVGKKYE